LVPATKTWVVYAKHPFGGAQHALRYLGQSTHRVAISNHRLVALADGKSSGMIGIRQLKFCVDPTTDAGMAPTGRQLAGKMC
jgi:hypothetical protein